MAATAAGVSRYDGELGRFGDEDVRQYVAALKAQAAALEECRVDTLEDEIDRTALLGDTRAAISRLEYERPHVRNPCFWLSHLCEGLYLLLALRDRPADHRVRAARSRLAAAPGFLALAKATLRDCPRVHVEAALKMCEGGLGLLEGFDRALGGAGGAQFESALTAAGDAVEQFLAYLRDDLLPHGSDTFAIGEKAFHVRLHHQLALRQTATALLRYGWVLVADTERELEAIARHIDGNAAWPDVMNRLRDEHPEAGRLVEAYASEAERARRFVHERDVVALPEGTLEVVATPRFLRPLTPFAAYQPPGAFANDRTGWFYVTPPDDGAPAEIIDQQLRDHCYADLPSTTLHEAYPGHHVHFLYMVGQDRPVRKVVLSPVMIEGWALYCEDMMAEQGFYGDPAEVLFQKRALLARAVRIVADIGLHTQGMSFDEAVDLLVAHVHFDRSHAEAEVRRYCAEPCYQLSYAVGRWEILRLRDAYRAAAGADFSLRAFHDRLLGYGGLPVTLARWGMGLAE